MTPSDEFWMKKALQLAHRALKQDEVPVGALIVDADHNLIGFGHNRREKMHSVLGHAEILALHRAQRRRGSWRLPGSTLYITLEPCPMCAGAIQQSRVERVVFGASDIKTGAAGSVYQLLNDKRSNHQCAITGGVLAEQCSSLLSSYFRGKREVKREQKRNQRT